MKIVLRIAVAGLAAGAAGPSAWAQTDDGTDKALNPAGINRLMSEAGGRARVSLHPATGAARFVRIDPGAVTQALPGLRTAAAAREEGAAFLQRHGSVFGIRDVASELQMVAEQGDRQGGRHFTYQQFHAGVPVFAGMLRSHLDAQNRVRAVNGTFVPGIDLSVTPSRTQGEAGRVALARVAAEKPQASGVTVRGTRLLVYREGLIKGVAGPNRLVWEVEVGNGGDVREFVFVDAHTNKWVDQITGIHEEMFRRAYDGQNLPVVPPGYPASPYWVEGDPRPVDGSTSLSGPCSALPGNPDCNQEAENMVQASEETYGLFSAAFGRDSFDGAGATLDSIFDRGYGCVNASWNGVFISFCPGTTTDDITAHEWGHAYTQYTHNLIYQWQPGALNESYSDIWGEVVDLVNGRGLDSPGGPRSAGTCTAFTLTGELLVNAPAGIAGVKVAQAAQFGPPLTAAGVTGEVVVAVDVAETGGTTTDGCSAITNVAEVSGKIALVDRGLCNFSAKVYNAQLAGATAVIIANNVAAGLPGMGAGVNAALVTIPSLGIGQADGNAIKANLPGVDATLRARGGAADNSYRWLMGEESPAFGGAIRDMWDPTCYSNPGKVSDTLFYVCSTADSGGVHTNSGIPNHAFALLVDGGSYNGQTVTAIGLTKAAHLYYHAQTVYQTFGTDFAEHADALEQSCEDLTGVDLNDLTTGLPTGESIDASDCAQVAAAIAAVELRTPPTFCNFQPILDQNPPARCDAGTSQVNVFKENFGKNPFRRHHKSDRWTETSEPVVPEDFTPRDWNWVDELPDDRRGHGVFAPATDIGTCFPGGDESGLLRLTSPKIKLPEGASAARLTFDHWFALEPGWDGGNLEISVNDGPFAPIAFTDFTYNSYKFLLFSAGQGNTNPLAGLPAFTATDGGSVDDGTWGRSHVSLANYATGGDTVRLRWNLGTDGCGGRVGWYLDDVVVYACTSDTPPDISVDDISVAEGTSKKHGHHRSRKKGGKDDDTPATFTIRLSHPSSETVWVWFDTDSGTARSGHDFEKKEGKVRIDPLELTATVTVDVEADRKKEPDEVFYLELEHAKNGKLLDDVGQCTIVNDDF